MTVKIYIHHTIHAPKAKSGAYAYILEADMSGKVATLSKTGVLEDTKYNKAELEIVLKALKRLNKPCEVTIVGLSNYTINGVNKWLQEWALNGFRNAQGKDIANREEWQQVYEYTKMHKIKPVGICQHEYLYWMQEEVKNALL